jgi:hypothetical protein
MPATACETRDSNNRQLAVNGSQNISENFSAESQNMLKTGDFFASYDSDNCWTLLESEGENKRKALLAGIRRVKLRE